MHTGYSDRNLNYSLTWNWKSRLFSMTKCDSTLLCLSVIFHRMCQSIYICDAIREKGPTIQNWKFTRRAIEEIAAALNAFKDFFSIIHLSQNNVDKTFLIAAHERSIEKLIESRIIRKSIFWIVGPFSRIGSHISSSLVFYLSSTRKLDIYQYNYTVNYNILQL